MVVFENNDGEKDAWVDIKLSWRSDSKSLEKTTLVQVVGGGGGGGGGELGVVRHQAITWDNVDSDQCRHIEI